MSIKPPVGVSPHWYVHNRRIAELSEAIKRYAEFTHCRTTHKDSINDYKVICKWAKEIEKLANMQIEIINEVEDER